MGKIPEIAEQTDYWIHQIVVLVLEIRFNGYDHNVI